MYPSKAINFYNTLNIKLLKQPTFVHTLRCLLQTAIASVNCKVETQKPIFIGFNLLFDYTLEVVPL